MGETRKQVGSESDAQTVDNSLKTVDNSTQLWRNRSLVRRKLINRGKWHPHIWGMPCISHHIWKMEKRRSIHLDLIRDFSTCDRWAFRCSLPDISPVTCERTRIYGHWTVIELLSTLSTSPTNTTESINYYKNNAWISSLNLVQS